MKQHLLFFSLILLLAASCSDPDYGDYRQALRSGNPRMISRYIRESDAPRRSARAARKLERMYYRRANSVPACSRYLEKYPEGKYVEKIKERREDLMFKNIGESVFAVREYLREYPQGKYRNHPRVRESADKVRELTRKLRPAEIDSLLQKVKNTEALPVEENEYAIIETRFGRMKMRFFPEKAPQHCANFKRLAESGYYDGVTFHRIIPGFMIQGGDINSRDGNRRTDGTGGPGYTIDAEFNDIPHEPGIVSMARTPDPNSAGSQFFICDGSPHQLNGQYTVFGEIIDGKHIIGKIAAEPRDGTDNPRRPVYMRVYMVKE